MVLPSGGLHRVVLSAVRPAARGEALGVARSWAGRLPRREIRGLRWLGEAKSRIGLPVLAIPDRIPTTRRICFPMRERGTGTETQ